MLLKSKPYAVAAPQMLNSILVRFSADSAVFIKIKTLSF
jgi:hypothetical protein